MNYPSLDELIRRKVIRGDKSHEVYNKMTDEELEAQKSERGIIHKENSIRTTTEQDIDYCIMYDILKQDYDYSKTLTERFQEDCANLQYLYGIRRNLVNQASNIYAEYFETPLDTDARKYMANIYESITAIDVKIKKIEPLYNPDWKGIITDIV